MEPSISPHENSRLSPFEGIFDIAPGVLIGNYQITRKIGRGGAGVVYLAYDKTLQREVVLKFLIHRSDKSLQRFYREIETTSTLDHPNIARIYKVFFFQEHPCIVMQYIKGNTLQKVITADRLSLKQKLSIVLQIANALEYAHQNQIIHRDVKPSNILIDLEGQPYLLDFGIARISKGAKNLTKTGDIIGSLGYMSPEQAKGKRNLHKNTDIYSLGAVMYELLTGKKMFATDNMMTFLYDVSHSTPIPIRELNDKIPVNVEKIWRKATQKKVRARYSCCEDIIQDIQRALKGEKVTKINHRMVIFFICVVLCIVLCAVGYSKATTEISQENHSYKADSTATEKVLFDRAKLYYAKKRYLKAKEDCDRIISKKSNNPDAYHLRGKIHKSQKNWKESARDYEHAIHLNLQNAEIYWEYGKVLENLQRPNKARIQFKKSLEHDRNSINALFALAFSYHYHKKEDLKKAQNYYQRVLKIQPDLFKANYHLGILHQRNSSLESAKKHLYLCHQKFPNHSEVLWALGDCFYYESNYKTASEFYQKSVAVRPLANRCVHLGNIFKSLNKFQEAEKMLLQAKSLNFKKSPAICALLNLYGKQKRHIKARSLYKNYISKIRPKTAKEYFHLAEVHRSYRKFPAAIRAYSRAIEFYPNANWLFFRAICYRNNRQYIKAKNDLNTAILLFPKADYYAERSEVFYQIRRYLKALKDIESAIKKQPKNESLFVKRAIIFAAMKRFAQAEKSFQHAIALAPNKLHIYRAFADYYESRQYYDSAIDVLVQAEKRGYELTQNKLQILILQKNIRAYSG